MPYHYSDYIAGQESPESCPNELAYHLSNVVAVNHFTIHQALVALNPPILLFPTGVSLVPGWLGKVEAELDFSNKSFTAVEEAELCNC